MRSRLFHRPELHTAHSKHGKRVGWLELFYDLIFVAAFIQLGNGLSASPTIETAGVFAIVFTSLWFAWTGYTFFSNRFNIDDFLHRWLVFAQMITIAGMAAFAKPLLDGDSTPFVLFYSAAQFIVALFYARTWAQATEGRDNSRYWGSVFLIGGLLWIGSIFTPPAFSHALWALSIVGYLAAPFSRASRTMMELNPYDIEHLTERYGLLTIIVLGEAFVKVLTGLSSEPNGELFLQSVFTLLITFTLWWLYFDDIASSKIRQRKFSFNFWLYGHLPLHAAIVAAGVGIQKATHFNLTEIAPAPYRWLLCASLSLAFFSVGIIDWATERTEAQLNDRMRVAVRLSSSALLMVLGPASQGMGSALLISLICVICLAQVAFDMLMAPFEETKYSAGEIRNTSDVVRERMANKTAPPPRPRGNLAATVRKGTPSDMRTDLYSFFLEASWPAFLSTVVILYLLSNVFFAGLFMLEPGAIENARPDSFADSFFFSIQTMATIGYGKLNPGNSFGNCVVVIEAVFSLSVTALVTGLMVAKASRPVARVVFSKVAVVNSMNGKPYLMFRVGNTKGSDIISAEMTMTMLRDEISAEGEHVRRMYDMQFTRGRSPFFSLTWLLMHEINESSPLKSLVSTGQLDRNIISFICVLAGHEATFGQTVYARHTFAPEDIRINAHFEDVISQLPDGRLMVDYSKIHDIRDASVAFNSSTEA